MQRMQWLSWLGTVAVAVMMTGAVRADVTSDRPAALLEYPLIFADQPQAPATWDTLVQLSNTSNVPVLVHCFYVNANAHCSGNGDICDPRAESSPDCGLCVPGWNEIDFRVRLTPRQPVGWMASEGFAGDDLPLPGNRGTRVPPLPENPFIGSLKCVAVDDTGAPLDQNVLKGEASLFFGAVDDSFDVAKYNAVGLEANSGAVNADNVLVLGGPEPEYEGCPNILILNHFFDGVELQVREVPSMKLSTELALVPCEQDLLRQIPAKTVVQYLVFNEFEQRFSTSRTVDCFQNLPLSLIDTSQPERSIFSAGVAGTVVGQTRLNPLSSGLVGVAVERYNGVDAAAPKAAFNIHFQGRRAEADLVTLP